MSQKKTLHTKTKPVQKDVETEGEIETTEIDGPKAKKEIDLEAALEPAVIVEEKIEDDIASTPEDGEDELGEEAVLDDEELNPFGDKWEQ